MPWWNLIVSAVFSNKPMGQAAYNAGLKLERKEQNMYTDFTYG